MLKRIIFWAGLVAIVVIAIEFFSFAALSLRSRRVSSARSLFTTFRSETPGKDGCTWADTVSLHPFFAYKYQMGGRCEHERINVEGLVGRPIPIEKDKEAYTILVLGGSVAEQFFDYQLADGIMLFEQALNSLFLSPTGKPFRVLNASIAAEQQPMQAIYFLFYRDRADAVISLEGFNEVRQLTYGIPLEEPPRIWYQLAGRSVGRPWEVVGDAIARNLFDRFQRSPIFGKSYAAFLLASSAVSLTNHHEKKPPIRLFPIPPTPQELRKRYYASYRKFLLSFLRLAASEKMPAAVFFQPVPALSKRLTDRERSVVDDLSYGPSYRDLLQEVAKPLEQEFAVFELEDMFRNFDGELYRDPIHFLTGGPGNSMLAIAISEDLGKAWHLRRKLAP